MQVFANFECFYSKDFVNTAQNASVSGGLCPKLPTGLHPVGTSISQTPWLQSPQLKIPSATTGCTLLPTIMSKRHLSTMQVH